MKKAIFGLAICLASISAYAAQEENKHAQESSDSRSFGGTIGPVFQLSKFGDGTIATLGGRINATLFNMFLLGIGGHGAIAQSNLNIEGTAENDLSYYYGGLGLGVRFFPDSFIHLTSYNTFGIGHLNLKGRGQSGLAYSIEPELNVEMDFLSLIRVGAGLSYRWMFSNDVKVPSSSLSGFGGQLFVEFGWL